MIIEKWDGNVTNGEHFNKRKNFGKNSISSNHWASHRSYIFMHMVAAHVPEEIVQRYGEDHCGILFVPNAPQFHVALTEQKDGGKSTVTRHRVEFKKLMKWKYIIFSSQRQGK